MPTGIETFKSYVLRLEDNELIDPVLSNVIVGQIDAGGIKPHRNTAPNGVIFDWKTNTIYYDEVIFANVVSNFTTRIKNMLDKQLFMKDDKNILRRMMGEDIGKLLATLLYNGMHCYNKNQRGTLIDFEKNRRFYGAFFYRSMYEGTGELTTISRKAASLWYRQYLQLILEYFEIPMYHGVFVSEETVKQIVGAFVQIHDEIYHRLEKYDIDQPSLDGYKEWFEKFIEEFKICIKNQDHRILGFGPKFLEKYEFKTLTFSCLDNAYNRISPVSTAKIRYPVPIFRELFITAEPMAQYIYSLSISGKLTADPEIQRLCARGLSFLS